MNRREFITKTGVTAVGLAAAGPMSAVFASGASMPSAASDHAVDALVRAPMLRVEGITLDADGLPLRVVERLQIGTLFDGGGHITLNKAFRRIDSIVFEMSDQTDHVIEV